MIKTTDLFLQWYNTYDDFPHFHPELKCKQKGLILGLQILFLML